MIGSPRIMLFDEATNWLDNESQAKVMRNLTALTSTRVVIAHRLSTLEQADRIYVLQAGKGRSKRLFQRAHGGRRGIQRTGQEAGRLIPAAGENFPKRFAERVLSARWLVIAITLIAGRGRVERHRADPVLEANYRIFFDDDNPQLLALEALENTYGKNENLVFLIVPDDGDATSQSALSAAVWLTEAAWKTPYSRRVDSLANFQHTTADGDDLYVRDLVDPQQLDRAEARALIRSIASTDPRIAGSILSRKGDVSVVNVTVEIPEEGLLEAVAEVAEFARSVAGEAEERFPGIDLRIVGTVMISQTFVEASIDSQMIFLPASLLLMALILGVLTRSWSGVAATGSVIVFSILASFGLGVWLGLPFSPPVSPAPTIVLMIVVANCVHLLVALQQRLRAGDSRRDAIVEADRAQPSSDVSGEPHDGARVPEHELFRSAALSRSRQFRRARYRRLLPPFRHFHAGAAFASPHSRPEGTAVPRTRDEPPWRISVLRYRKPIFWGWVVIVPVMMLAIPRNELNDVLVHFFDESVEFRQDTDFMDEHLSGNTLLEYSLQASVEGGVTDPLFLTEVSKFADWYREQPPVRHVSVITDTFRQLNKSMRGDDPAAYRIPESRELAAQYLLLYELSLPQGLNLNNQIDRSRSATRVTISAETLYSREVLALNARAEAWLKENAPHVAGVNSTGPAALFAYIGQRNIRAMLIGTMVVLLGDFRHSSLRPAFAAVGPDKHRSQPGSRRAGLRGLGVDGGTGEPVAVRRRGDDRRHRRGRHGAFPQQVPARAARTRPGAPTTPCVYAFDTAGLALFTTTVVLVAGFLIFVFAPFVPTAQVGVLTALIIAFALIADLTLLPALLTAADRRSAGAGRARDLIRRSSGRFARGTPARVPSGIGDLPVHALLARRKENFSAFACNCKLKTFICHDPNCLQILPEGLFRAE